MGAVPSAVILSVVSESAVVAASSVLALLHDNSTAAAHRVNSFAEFFILIHIGFRFAKIYFFCLMAKHLTEKERLQKFFVTER